MHDGHGAQILSERESVGATTGRATHTQSVVTLTWVQLRTYMKPRYDGNSATSIATLTYATIEAITDT
jgi:hypothetical protein